MARKEIPTLNLDDPGHKALLIAHIKALKGLYRIEITRCKDQRSLDQNAYYWGVVLPVIANGLTESWGEHWDSERLHHYFADRFRRRATLNKHSGEIVGHETVSTTAMDVSEMGIYLESCIEFGREYAGVEVPAASRYRRKVVAA